MANFMACSQFSSSPLTAITAVCLCPSSLFAPGAGELPSNSAPTPLPNPQVTPILCHMPLTGAPSKPGGSQGSRPRLMCLSPHHLSYSPFRVNKWHIKTTRIGLQSSGGGKRLSPPGLT